MEGKEKENEGGEEEAKQWHNYDDMVLVFLVSLSHSSFLVLLFFLPHFSLVFPLLFVDVPFSLVFFSFLPVLVLLFFFLLVLFFVPLLVALLVFS